MPSKFTRSSAEMKVRLVWPLHSGEDIEFAHHFMVSQTPHGVLLEVGRVVIGGTAGHSAEEVQEHFALLPVNVLGRFLMPKQAAKDLASLIGDQLGNDSESPPEGVA